MVHGADGALAGWQCGMRFKLIQDRVSLNLAYFHITEFNVALTLANGYIFQGNVPGLVPKQTERVWVTYNLPKGFLPWWGTATSLSTQHYSIAGRNGNTT
jgi:hypothetical protein